MASERTCLWCGVPLARDADATSTARCRTVSCAMNGKPIAVPPTSADRFRELANDLGSVLNDLDPTGELRGQR